MNGLPLLFALLGLVAGCADPAAPGAIEVTGYLDASRITFTQLNGLAVAAGLDGATSVNATVDFTNVTTGDAQSATAGDAGAFVALVEAEDGDHLALRGADSPSDGQVVHDVQPDLPFPDAVAITGTPDPHDPDLTVVEVSFSPGRLDGRVWASDWPRSDVVVLDVLEHGALHTGRVQGNAGILLVHWVFDDGTATNALAVGTPLP